MTFKEQDHAGRRTCSEMSDRNSPLDPEVRAAWAELKRLDLPEFRQALDFPSGANSSQLKVLSGANPPRLAWRANCCA
jgi:hypothetical protein